MATITQREKRPPFWRNTTFIKWAAQALVLAGVVGLAVIAVRQVAASLRALQLDFSFDFVNDAAGFPISEGITKQPETVFEALKTAAINMLRVTISGIIAATVLGVLIGIARLSRNWIVNKAATGYVEAIRNVPLLVQMVFWLAFVQLTFPELTLESGPFPGTLHISNKGVSVASLFPADGFWQWMAFLVVGGMVARFVYRRRLRVMEETGAEAYAITYALAAFALLAAVGWFAHPLMGFLGWVFGAISSFFDAIPVVLIQVVIAAAGLGAGAWWIKRFLDSLRTPAGLAKLTDDDIFRIGFAAVVGVLVALAAFALPGISRTLGDWGVRFFAFADGKFDWLGTGSPLRVSRPQVVQPGLFASIGDTGLTMTPAFFAVWVALTLYTASFIAEVVRGGILAVPRGQSEAGLAMGLRRSQLLRLVILPQAFRIILPPLGNQYLNLAKNSSLGIAVAFPEFVAVGRTVFNQTGRSVEVIIIWMGFYLTVSLVLSAIVNYYNRKLKLVER